MLHFQVEVLGYRVCVLLKHGYTNLHSYQQCFHTLANIILFILDIMNDVQCNYFLVLITFPWQLM